MEICVYRGNETGHQTENGCPVYECRLLRECVASGGGPKFPSCDDCRHTLLKSSPTFASDWQDPLIIVNSRRESTDALRDSMGGRAGFLLCGGPSANDLDLQLLQQRGAWTMAVNNAAGHPQCRPNAFVCSDPPAKFHHSIWLDPGIMKFVPDAKLLRSRNYLRRKCEDGTFEPLEVRADKAPNVWGFRRRNWMVPDDTFFMEDAAAWGNMDEGVKLYGERKTACTMLIAIRLMYYLGFRTIFMLGVDFRMAAGLGYSFGQARDAGAMESNNVQYDIVNDWMDRLTASGTLDRFGLRMFNCFQHSGLRAFPYVPFDQALQVACKGIDQTPDLSEWYEKGIDMDGKFYLFVRRYEWHNDRELASVRYGRHEPRLAYRERGNKRWKWVETQTEEWVQDIIKKGEEQNDG